MAFLYEKDLKEKFWESYNRKGRAIKYEFESPIRDGNADLITIENIRNDTKLTVLNLNWMISRKSCCRQKQTCLLSISRGLLYR